MLDALMIVAGIVTTPMDAYRSKLVIYNTTPYENFETCQGHLKDRGAEIAKYLMQGRNPKFTFSEGETVLTVTTDGHETVTLMCKEN